MNLDDYKVYIFVRQDLPIAQQLVQATHATFHMGMRFGATFHEQSGIPFHVLIGVPNAKAMSKVLAKIQQSHLPHYIMTDTDVDAVNPTAVATFPMTGNDAQILSNYRLWRYTAGAAETSNAGLNASPPPRADVAQQ